MITAANLKQYLLLGLIIGAAILVATQLYAFFPGLLGAITLYILLRQLYFKVTVVYNWKKWLAAVVFILGSIVVFVMPFVLVISLLAPKIALLTHNPALVMGTLAAVVKQLQQYIPQITFNEAQLQGLVQRSLSNLPTFLGATLQVLTNLILCFFLLYFMLVEGRKMERKIQQLISLKDENIDDIWASTRTMVVSNAIGIPLLAIFQAISATIGYLIFGVEGAIVWGVLTGIFSLLPVIGTTAIWAPIVAYLFATGKGGPAMGLLLFSIVITVNIDNVLRFTLLRKLGDVHPVITVLGIIIGIPVFGFMGLIFGPLVLSYFLLLIRIYQVEFSARKDEKAAEVKRN
jgi:predicted PurR-regulated permease PerM